MERVAIVGTAQSWVNTPWNDPGLYILSLNDAYRLAGFVRADAWYDFHPLDKMFFAPGQKVYAHQVPAGAYVRPQEHLQWLASQSIPVWLHPDWQTQNPGPLAASKTAKAFPKAEIEAYFGRYFTSSPAWMIAHAILQGAKEVHVYGIHLATEQEYREQRPQFEFLLGRVLGPGKLTMTVNNGLRMYQTPNGRVVLPEASPVLQADFQYAFERRPLADLEPLKWEQHKYEIKKQRAIQTLKTAKWWQLGSTRAAQEELWRLEVKALDVQEQMSRLQLAQQIG